MFWGEEKYTFLFPQNLAVAFLSPVKIGSDVLFPLKVFTPELNWRVSDDSVTVLSKDKMYRFWKAFHKSLEEFVPFHVCTFILKLSSENTFRSWELYSRGGKLGHLVFQTDRNSGKVIW